VRVLRWVLFAIFGALLVGAGAALAYWSISVSYACSACGVAGAARLTTPSVTAVAVGSTQVDVAWTTPAAEPDGTVYLVTRTSAKDTSAVMTSDAVLHDRGLSAGVAYAYTVVAVLGDNWRSDAGLAGATPPIPTFSIDVAASSTAAGSAVTVRQVRAVAAGSTDITFTGERTLTWSGLVDSPAGLTPLYPGTKGATTQTVTFLNGVATIGTTFTPYAAGVQHLSVSDGTTKGTIDETVTALAASRLSFLSNATVVAGASFVATATIQDVYGNTVVDATNTVTFTQTAVSGGTLGGVPSGAQPPTGGVVSATLTGNHDGVLTLGVSSDIGLASKAVTVTGDAGPATITLTGGGSLAAGASTTLTATLTDAYGNQVTTGAGATTGVTFTKASGSGTVGGLSADPVAAVGGVATVTVTGNLDGSLVVRASAAGTTSSTQTITVSGFAAAARIGFTGGGNVTAGTNITLTAYVQDAYGNTVTSGSAASASIVFSKTSGTGTVSGMPGSSVGANRGIATVTLTANADGALIVQGQSSGLTTGTVTVTVVGASTPKTLLMTGGGSVRAGSTIALVTTVTDEWGNVVTDATTALSFSKTSGTGTVGGLPGSTVTPTNGVYTLTLTGNVVGSLVVQVTASSVSSATQTITVSGAGAAAKVDLSGGGSVAAGSTITLTATVRDAYGNTVTSSTDALTFTKASGTGTVGGLPASTVTPTNGVYSLTVTGNRAGSLVVQVSATGLTSGTQTVTVTGFGAASGINVTGSVASKSFTATIVDAYGNTVSSGSDASKNITFSKLSGTGTLNGLPYTNKASNGVLTIPANTLTNGTSGTITVQASSSVTAGTITGTITDTVP
jgi:hypothetical protein